MGSVHTRSNDSAQWGRWVALAFVFVLLVALMVGVYVYDRGRIYSVGASIMASLVLFLAASRPWRA